VVHAGDGRAPGLGDLHATLFAMRQAGSGGQAAAGQLDGVFYARIDLILHRPVF